MDRSDHGHLKQLLVDSLPDCALVVLDPEGKIVFATSGKYSDDKMDSIEEKIE